VTQYRVIEQINAAMPALRLICEERDKKTNEIRLKIQITGKNLFPVISLKDLKDPSLFNNFSKKDQEIIDQYVSFGRLKSPQRITARTYDRSKQQFVYTIEFFDSELNATKCKIIDNPTLLLQDIGQFDAEDALLIQSELALIQKNNIPTV
jgi:hypothetical protein